VIDHEETCYRRHVLRGAPRQVRVGELLEHLIEVLTHVKEPRLEIVVRPHAGDPTGHHRDAPSRRFRSLTWGARMVDRDRRDVRVVVRKDDALDCGAYQLRDRHLRRVARSHRATAVESRWHAGTPRRLA
jgi:hypothetical protein